MASTCLFRWTPLSSVACLRWKFRPKIKLLAGSIAFPAAIYLMKPTAPALCVGDKPLSHRTRPELVELLTTRTAVLPEELGKLDARDLYKLVKEKCHDLDRRKTPNRSARVPETLTDVVSTVSTAALEAARSDARLDLSDHGPQPSVRTEAPPPDSPMLETEFFLGGYDGTTFAAAPVVYLDDAPPPQAPESAASSSSEFAKPFLPPGKATHSDVWSFFRIRKADLITETHRAWCQVMEGDVPCPYRATADAPAGAVTRVARSTTELMRHLERYHGYTKDEIKTISASKEFPPQGRHNVKTPRVRQTESKSRASVPQGAVDSKPVQAEQIDVGPKQPRLFLKPLVNEILVKKLTQSWARKLVIHDDRPTTLAESTAFQEWLDECLRSCGATHKFQAPTHQQIGHALNEDMQLVQTKLNELLSNVPPECLVLHEDVWEDRWKRHWVGASIVWLDEEMKSHTMLIGFSQLEKHVDISEDDGIHAAITVARAVESVWRSTTNMDRLRMPAWNCSDNANPAVAVGKTLRMAQFRCQPHLLAIPVRRILHETDPRRKVIIPHAHPDLFNPWEKMRQIGKYYRNHPDRQEVWQRKQTQLDMSSLAHPMQDTSVKWDSSRQMAETYLKGAIVTEACLAQSEDHPACLTEGDKDFVQEQLPALDALHAAVSLLQGDRVLAGNFLPILHGLISRWVSLGSVLAKTLVLEWERIETVHLSVSPCLSLPPDHVCRKLLARVNSNRELLLLTTTALPEYSKVDFDGETSQVVRQDRENAFASFCWTAFQLSNPAVTDDTLMGSGNEEAIPIKEPLPKKAKKNVKGMAELLAAMGSSSSSTHRTAPDQTVAVEGSVVALRKTYRKELHAQAVAYMSHTHDARCDPAEWWRRTFALGNFLMLKPGVRILLQFRTGNAFLERCFSYSEHVTTDKRRKSYDVGRHMILRSCGHQCGIPGYLPFSLKATEHLHNVE